MPQALAFAVPGVFAATGSIALVTATGGLTLAGVAVSIGGALLFAALSQPDVPDIAKPQNLQTNSKSSAGPRLRHYGVVKVGGNVVFHRAKSGVSYRIVVHGHGEVSEVLQYYLNGEAVAFDGAGDITDDDYIQTKTKPNPDFHPPYEEGETVPLPVIVTVSPKVAAFSQTGTIPETSFAELTAVYSEWTAAHRLDGLWSTLIICQSLDQEEHYEMFPRGEPELTALAETSECYDPRTEVTEFTENMALAIADYIASPDGFNRPDAFEEQDIIDQANICDQVVALDGGGSEALYRISGTYLLNEKPQAVLTRMLDACAGRVRLKPSGKIGLKVGAWQDPAFTLEFGDISEVASVTSGPDLLDRYNELPGRFNSHDLGHVEVDAEPWRDESRIAEDGEVLTGPDKSLLMCPTHRQARQVMKIHMERDNPRQEVTLICKPRALPAIYEGTITLDVPQMGFSGNYEVAAHNLAFENGLLKTVSLTLRKVDSAAFSLGLSEQGTVQELPTPDTSSGVPVPTGFTAAGAGVQSSNSTFTAGISVVWLANSSDALAPVVKISIAGEENWRSISVGVDAVRVSIPGLIEGQDYDVTVAFRTAGGIVGDVVRADDVTATAASEAPDAPSALSVSDQGGSVALVELTAADSASLWKTEIYRDSVLIGSVYAGPGSEIGFLDNSGAGTFDWSARSINVSGVASASDVGPVTAVIA